MVMMKTAIESLQNLVPNLMETAVIPGVSLAIVQNDDIWQAQWGVSNATTRQPVTADTWFQAASLSKPVFAYAVLQLVLAGQLDLDTPLITYLSPAQQSSNLHFDHTGNGNLFAASTWIVDADERAAMFDDAARGKPEFAAYSALENAKTLLIEGDDNFDVFGDDSVVIYQTPGHTPGSTTLLVRTVGSGNVLLTGDMWHLAESRERHLVPSFNFSREQTLASMDSVEALATLNDARVVRQHVPEDFAAMPVFPAALQ